MLSGVWCLPPSRCSCSADHAAVRGHPGAGSRLHGPALAGLGTVREARPGGMLVGGLVPSPLALLVFTRPCWEAGHGEGACCVGGCAVPPSRCSCSADHAAVRGGRPGVALVPGAGLVCTVRRSRGSARSREAGPAGCFWGLGCVLPSRCSCSADHAAVRGGRPGAALVPGAGLVCTVRRSRGSARSCEAGPAGCFWGLVPVPPSRCSCSADHAGVEWCGVTARERS
ncbi:hypothetical protein J2Y00_002095 [Deinococcus soli (ex Cha et al. 2016)]|uniref:Uncharacterized protein n=2 Tax=Deinococcus soli (ex Cha et al. 2016) TaxID=1309411 RepID=A0ACC6KGA9_9DEIO|nr:hypothetical protein [Deinococcus soli (ex Cha et al. 2016)]MDR6329272.1 hypothetical protein [Deinococcus soli (ex Cha et al. 2016)]MDR6751545.1 hypothetical protein [Deinococcus soli (ex Cha et al. 2016)]